MDRMRFLFTLHCVPTYHIKHHRNVDIALGLLIAAFSTFTAERAELRKMFETKDFYVSRRCSTIIVSTCVVCGNMSTGVTDVRV